MSDESEIGDWLLHTMVFNDRYRRKDWRGPHLGVRGDMKRDPHTWSAPERLLGVWDGT